MPDREDELTGNAAQRFAEANLEKIEVDVVQWTTTYRDPRDGSEWLMDYPHSELHGGGPPRLRRIPRNPIVDERS
jgi:hypothetical protein